MTLPLRIGSIVRRALVLLHPCAYGELAAKDGVGEISAALRREVELLCPDRDAEKVVADFVATLPEIKRLVATDVEAAYEGDPAAAGCPPGSGASQNAPLY